MRAIMWGLILACVAARAWIDWAAPLLDEHGFRQTQTALTVYWYLHGGIDLLRPPMPVFGTEAPSIPFELPVYQAIVTLVLKAIGAQSLDAIAAACRLVACAFHLLAAWPLHRLARRHFSVGTADAAVLLWVATPYALFWSTTAMIEPAAVALSLLFVDRVDRSAGASGRAAAATMLAAAVLGAFAAVVKPTTFVLYLAVAGVLYAIGRRLWAPSRWRGRDVAALALMAGLPILAMFAWTGWADAVKAENIVGGAGLTSTRLSRWNFGTWEQRLSPETWSVIAQTLTGSVLSLTGTAFFLVGAARACGSTARSAWVVAMLLGPAVFTNLYFHHTYYFYAVLAPALVLMAFGLATIAGWIATAATVDAGRARVVLTCAVVAAVWVEVAHRVIGVDDFRWGAPGYYLVRRVMPDPPLSIQARRILEVADAIRAEHFPPGPVVVTGNDWSPDIAFYSERPAIMVAKHGRHPTGPCNRTTWDVIRRSSAAVFVKLLPSPDLCPDAVPVPACTVRATERYWIGRCMAGTSPGRAEGDR